MGSNPRFSAARRTVGRTRVIPNKRPHRWDEAVPPADDEAYDAPIRQEDYDGGGRGEVEGGG